jgi:enediyne core biosynthesis thioesterase
MQHYEHRHVVSFEETNVVGNVYYVNPIRWQGICREMFIHEHAHALLSDLANGLLLVTVRCSCNYFAEIFAFDEILIRMRLSELTQNRITMTFDYARRDGAGEQIVARGEQQIACMRRDSQRSVPVPVPSVLREALLPYMHTDSDR